VLLATAERRWRADRFDNDFDVRVLTDWLWDEDAHHDEQAAATVIDAANDLAYALGPTRPVVLIPHATLPTVQLARRHHGAWHHTSVGGDSGWCAHRRCAARGLGGLRRARPREPAVLLSRLAGR
jgi:hypothetical protein